MLWYCYRSRFCRVSVMVMDPTFLTSYQPSFLSILSTSLNLIFFPPYILYYNTYYTYCQGVFLLFYLFHNKTPHIPVGRSVEGLYTFGGSKSPESNRDPGRDPVHLPLMELFGMTGSAPVFFFFRCLHYNTGRLSHSIASFKIL